MTVEIVCHPNLRLNELQELATDLVNAAPHQETLIVCSLGLYEIIEVEDYQHCKDAGQHESAKNITVKMKLDDAKEVCKVQDDFANRMLSVREALESLSGNVRVLFTTILPISLEKFRGIQVKAHESNGLHELDSEYMPSTDCQSASICEFLCSLNREILKKVNLDHTKQKIEWNLLKAHAFPNAASIEKHLEDGLNPCEKSVQLIMAPHLKDIIMKHSKAYYHRIVLLQDFRISDLDRWTRDFTYLNFKVMAMEKGSIQSACTEALPELPVFKQSLIVVSLGLYDLVKLTEKPEPKVEFLFKGKSTEEACKEMMDNMRQLKNLLKKRYIGCDVIFSTICQVDLLSYLEEHSKSSKGGSSQESIPCPSEELSKIRDIIEEVNKVIRSESQAMKLPLWDFCNMLYDSSEEEASKNPKRIPKSIVYDGVHLTKKSVLRIMEACLAYTTALYIHNKHQGETPKAKKMKPAAVRSETPLSQKKGRKDSSWNVPYFKRQFSPERRRENRQGEEDRSFRYRGGSGSSSRRSYTRDKSLSPSEAATGQFRRSGMSSLETKDTHRLKCGRDTSTSPFSDHSRYKARSGHAHKQSHARFGERDSFGQETHGYFSRRPASPRREGWRSTYSPLPLDRDGNREGWGRSNTPPDQRTCSWEERSHSPPRRQRSPKADQRHGRAHRSRWNHSREDSSLETRNYPMDWSSNASHYPGDDRLNSKSTRSPFTSRR